MQSARALISVIGIAAAVIFYWAFTFVVDQRELAIKLRLGEIVDSDYLPGLHWRVPILHNVMIFDRRIQTLDAKAERFLTVEKKDVIVDYYIKWRIDNVAQFFRSTGGIPQRAGRLLEERVNTALRDEFGKRTIQEVVSGERREIMDKLTKKADEQASDLGLEIIDVRMKKIDLPTEVSESVYGRMRAERERVARDLRARGAEAAERIRADADRQRIEIVADAFRQAETVRGEGDAEAASIYANAFDRNRDFYAFWRSLDAYQRVFGEGGDMMVLEPDSEFFRYFKDPKGAQ
ncbi:MAG: protease modulator HflC [Pseudomonadota bacterium]